MIKGFLKGLCILLLTLLPISFSNALVIDYTSPFTITSLYCTKEVDYYVKSNSSFVSYYNGVEKNGLLYFIGSSYTDCRNNQYFVVGWKNGQLYGFFKSPSIEKQGYFSSYGLCNSETCTMNLTFDDFKTFLNNHGVLGFRFSNGNPNSSQTLADSAWNSWNQYCLVVNDVLTPYACFFASIPNSYTFNTGVDYQVSDWNDLNSWNGFFSNSPIKGGSVETVYSGVDVSNGAVFDSYERVGFSKNVCYGGVSTGSNYNSLIPGTGLSVFELYSRYNQLGFSTIDEWYNYYRYGYVDDPVSFSTGSVFNIDGVFRMPLYGLFFMGSRFGVSIYPTSDIIEYCDMLINKKSDPNWSSSIYTGSNPGGVISWIINNNYYGSGGYMFTGGSWQVYPTSPIAELSGEDLSWDSDSYFQYVSNKFANMLDSYDVGVLGFIPSYILAFMFALILIRMIQR